MIMKRLILSFVLSLVFSFNFFAYDFSVKKDSHGKTIYYNITSAPDAKIKTCEITYSDCVIVDGEAKYNQNNEHYKGYISCEAKVSFQGVEYWVTGIGDHAFQDTEIIEIDLLSSVISFFLGEEMVVNIGKDAFKNCTFLKQFIMQDNLSKKFGERAFENCTSLERVWLISNTPPTHTINNRISSMVFHGCTNLNEFFIESLKPENFQMAEDAFDIQDGKIKCRLTVMPGNKVYFEDVQPWCLFSEIIEDEKVECAIEDIQTRNQRLANSPTFDMTGKKTSSQKKKGVYIVNGRKVMRKE